MRLMKFMKFKFKLNNQVQHSLYNLFKFKKTVRGKMKTSKTYQMKSKKVELEEETLGQLINSMNRQKNILEISVKSLINQIQQFQNQSSQKNNPSSKNNKNNNKNKNNALYNQLQAFDKVMKKYQIDQLSQIALEIYEYLVQKDSIMEKQQTISSTTKAKSRESGKNSKKNQISLMKDLLSKKKVTVHMKQQVQKDLSPKNHNQSRHRQIEYLKNQQQQFNTQSLETPINMNLFSFAKNNQKGQKNQQYFSNMKLKGTKLSFNNEEVQKDREKGKSYNKNQNDDKISQKILSSKSITQKANSKSTLRDQNKNQKIKIKNNVSSFSLLQSKKQVNVNKKDKKSTSSQSQILEVRELYLQTLDENQKQKNNKHQISLQKSQIIKQTQPNEQEQFKTERNKSEKTQNLIKFIVQKRFNQFIRCLNMQKKVLRNLFKLKTAKFFYHQTTLRKCMKQLVLNWKQELLLQKRADQYASSKQEQILQEYFLQWKARAQMSEISRKKQQELDQKSVKLVARIFFIRFSNFASQNNRILKQNQQIQKKHKSFTLQLYQSIFLSNLLVKTETIKNQQSKVEQTKKIIFYHESQCFLNVFTNYVNLKKIRQNQNVLKCSKLINGKQIIQKIKQNANFLEVYWKNWTSTEKIIFLSIFLSRLKNKFQREGYTYEWMKDLQSNLEYIDHKLKNPLKTKLKHKAFEGLKLLYGEQKLKKVEIKRMFSQRFLTSLAINSYQKYKQQSLDEKSAQFRQFLFYSNSNIFINSLIYQNQNSLLKKITFLKIYLKKQKSLQTFRYFSSYKSNKKYYQNQLFQFKNRWNTAIQQKYFLLIKRVLRQRILNKKLTQQYLYLKDRILLQNCFNSIKQFIFEKKLTHKKQSNFRKLLLVECYDRFLVGLRNLKSQKTIQDIIQCEKELNQKNYQDASNKLLKKLRQNFQLRKLKRSIKASIDQTLALHLKSKIFEALKLIKQQNNKQKQISSHITQKKNNKTKRQTFQRMIQVLLIHEGIRKLITFLNTIENNYQKQSFELLKISFLNKNNQI